MLNLSGIRTALAKLEKQNKDDPGEIKYTETGRKENRYSYYYKGIMIFTFGITSGSQAKSKTFDYVPRQMHLKRQQYKSLHDCPWTKANYNEELAKKGIIQDRSPLD